MKDLIASIYAVCLSSLLWAPIFVPQEAKADLIINPFVFDSTPAPTYLVDEDFEETGIPTVGTWVEQSGTFNWDATGYGFVGEHVVLSAGDAARVEFAGQTQVWAAGKIYITTGTLPGATTSYVGLRNSAWGGATVLRIASISATQGSIGVYGNGADLATAATFRLITNTIHYWVLKYESGGVCELKISTTPSFGAVPTDSATQYSVSFTDTNSYTIDRLDFRIPAYTNGHRFDAVYVSTAELTNPWGE